MRLIELDSLWKCDTCFYMQNETCTIRGECDHGEEYHPAYNKLKPIEAEPVMHGQWEKTEDDFYMGLTIFKCSVCREEWVFEDMSDVDGLNYNYCPNCGATMDGGAE